MNATQTSAYRLMHDGALAMARAEANGIKVDLEYLAHARDLAKSKIKKFEEKLQADDVYEALRRRFGTATNPGSRPQLARVLFGDLGYKTAGVTDKGNVKVDKTALETLDLPYVKTFLRCEQWKKCLNTYLDGIWEEQVGGFLHPFFNLNTVETFRGSSDKINFQNIPVRDPELGPLVRRCFTSRHKDWLMAEIDYGSLEFGVAANFWKDPDMIRYASDPDLDIHRDEAAELMLCRPKQVSKLMRYYGKNGFVFPVLYGSDWVNISRNIWEAIQATNEKGEYLLKLEDGTTVKDHLAAKGVTKLGSLDRQQGPDPGTYAAVVRKVQRGFDERFPVFGRGKQIWYDRYQKLGYFDMMTGFRVYWGKGGPCSRNNLMNTPIQGPGFHCLLWSFCRMQEWLDRYDMNSLLIGQIHDCKLGDVDPDEIQDYLDASERIMTKKIRKHWDWIVAPLKVEVDVVPPGQTWQEKASWVKDGTGSWGPKKKKAG